MTKRFENSCAEIGFRIKTSCCPMTWPANWMKVAILCWSQYVKIIILNEWQRYTLLKIKVVTSQIFHISFYKMHAVTGYWGYYFHTFPDNLWLSVLLVWLDLWWNNIKIMNTKKQCTRCNAIFIWWPSFKFGPIMLIFVYGWLIILLHAWLIRCWMFPPGTGINKNYSAPTLIARFMGPTWGPSGDDSTQVGPMLAPWTLLSG